MFGSGEFFPRYIFVYFRSCCEVLRMTSDLRLCLMLGLRLLGCLKMFAQSVSNPKAQGKQNILKASPESDLQVVPTKYFHVKCFFFFFSCMQ